MLQLADNNLSEAILLANGATTTEATALLYRFKGHFPKALAALKGQA